MRNTPDTENVQALLDILIAENSYLLKGNIANAIALRDEKLRLLESLDEKFNAGVHDLDPRFLVDIQGLARTNARLMQAILQGLRGAVARVDRLAHDSSVGAYDPNGSQLPFNYNIGGFFKRV